MGIGIGILLLVIGLIILFAINEFPASLQEVVEPTTVGWILVIAGVLALVLALVMNNQRSRTTHVEERRDLEAGSEPATLVRDPGGLAARASRRSCRWRRTGGCAPCPPRGARVRRSPPPVTRRGRTSAARSRDRSAGSGRSISDSAASVGVDHAQPGVHAADGVGELLGRACP